MERKKKIITPVISEAEVTGELRTYADSSSQLKKLEAEIELKIQETRDKSKTKIESLRKLQEGAFEKLQKFAEFNKDTMFIDKKSREYIHGTIGFRIGTPKATGCGQKALELLKELKLPFIRIKEEIDKEKIVASRNDEAIMAKLEKISIRVVQDETFYVEPKQEELVNA